MASMEALHRCVSSLYDDQVRPTLAIIRRRYQELEGREVSLPELSEQLAKAPWATLTGPAANPCALLDRDPPFVDPLDPSDPYPPTLWRALDQVLADMADKGTVFRGGRYGCAQELRQLKLLESYSLGQVQHMVQLLIERMHLRYVRSGKGTLAPLARCCSTASSSHGSHSGSRGTSPQKSEDWARSTASSPPLTFDQLAWGPSGGTTWAPADSARSWMSPLCALPIDGPDPDAAEQLAAEVARLLDSPTPSPRLPVETRAPAAPERSFDSRAQRFEWVVASTKLRSKDKVAVSRVLTTAQGNFKMLLAPRGENFGSARQGSLQLKCLDPPKSSVAFRFLVGHDTSAIVRHDFGSCAVSAPVALDLPAQRPADAGLQITLELL